MIARLLMLLLLGSVSLLGDAEQDVTDVVSLLASALSANNPQLFLSRFDHAMPGYRQLEQAVNALAGDTLVACSVELISTKGTPSAQSADLDWYMSLKSQQDENLIERRRTKVAMKIEKRGKKWIVVSFSPISVFTPMTAR